MIVNTQPQFFPSPGKKTTILYPASVSREKEPPPRKGGFHQLRTRLQRRGWLSNMHSPWKLSIPPFTVDLSRTSATLLSPNSHKGSRSHKSHIKAPSPRYSFSSRLKTFQGSPSLPGHPCWSKWSIISFTIEKSETLETTVSTCSPIPLVNVHTTPCRIAASPVGVLASWQEEIPFRCLSDI